MRKGENQKLLYAGIDACRLGWVGVIMAADLRYVSPVHFWQRTEDMLEAAGDWPLSLIDIPIGLTDRAPGVRKCEPMARKILGVRHASIFPPPVRQVFRAKDYREASRVQSEVSGKKLSKQSWNIVPKIRAVDGVLRRRPALQQVLRESHPEVCFCMLNQGKTMQKNKKTPSGRNERLRVIDRFACNGRRFFATHAPIFPASILGADDLIDAMVLALTAALSARHGLLSLPKDPEFDRHGLRMEIVYTLPTPIA